MRDHLCFANNHFITENELCLNVYDLGLLRGYGVFDFLRTYKGKPFLLDEHILRLKKSAELLNITLPYAVEEIKQKIIDLVRKNNKDESTVRVILTGGVSQNGISRPNSQTFIILTRDLKPIPEETYSKGVKLIVDEYKRQLPEAKHLDYSNLLSLEQQVISQGAFTLLYQWRGYVSEAAISNFFIIKNGEVITPNKGILFGTTRNLLIKLISPYYKITERKLRIDEVIESDEAFITGTTQGVVPVTQIDENIIGTGKVGMITKNIIEEFNKYVERFTNE